MNVTPDPGSLYFSATEAVVLPANEVRITNIFDEDNKPTIDDFPYTIAFSIDGVQNQRAAVEAGPVEFTTEIQFGADVFYVVDIGEIDESFVATTTQITIDSVDVSDPMTNGVESIYTVSFTLEAGVPEDGYLFIDIPKTVIMNADNVRSSGSCALADTIICEEVIEDMFPGSEDTYGTITIKTKEQFFANVPYSLDFGGITNPRNTERSEIFVINSFDNDKIQQIGKGEGGNVKMTDLAPIDKFSGKNSDSRNGQSNTYAFAVDVNF